VHSRQWWNTPEGDRIRELPQTLFLEAMASCTEITYVNNSLVGDPLDVKMFEATGWVLDEPSSRTKQEESVVHAMVYPKDMRRVEMDQELESNMSTVQERQFCSAIIRRFEFSSALQRMSVICKNEYDNRFRIFVKGSPEMISTLCMKHTLPDNFNEILEKYTKEGFRVIALSQKLMPLNFKYRQTQTCKREEAECDLEFLGLLVMENKLKPESNGILQTLNECEIRTVMATGDNVLTAISVARQCKMLDPAKPVYLGEVVMRGNEKTIVWNRTEAYN